VVSLRAAALRAARGDGGGAVRLPPIELARLAGGGDREAFEELVRGYQRRVYGFAYQYVRDAGEAQDVTQEIFVHLYRNLRRYDAARPFEPWFWRLATNVCLNYVRRRVPEPRELPDSGDAGGDPAELPGESALARALGELDRAYRLPLILHYHLDMSLQQVAQTMGLSVAAVKSRMHRGRAVLRRTLSEEAG